MAGWGAGSCRFGRRFLLLLSHRGHHRERVLSLSLSALQPGASTLPCIIRCKVRHSFPFSIKKAPEISIPFNFARSMMLQLILGCVSRDSIAATSPNSATRHSRIAIVLHCSPPSPQQQVPLQGDLGVLLFGNHGLSQPLPYIIFNKV